MDYLTFKLQLRMMLNAGTEASIEAHIYLLYSLEKTSTYKVSMSQNISSVAIILQLALQTPNQPSTL